MQKVIDAFIYSLNFLYLYIRNRCKVKTALFYPRKPSHKAIVSRILKKLHYNITINPNAKYNIVVNWIDATFRESDSFLESIKRKSKVINAECYDISKSYIGKIFEDVFGYSIIVDPLTFAGKCVRKNNLNARKTDSKILDCPIAEIEKDFVYVKLINTKIDDKHVLDYRVPVIGNSIPLIYLKTKPFATIFQSQTVDLKIAEPKDYLSESEIENIIIFCRRIGLDSGELDVLRDNIEGKIYIVDANNTPWGPPKFLTKEDKKLAVHILSQAFEKEFLVNR